MVYLMVFYMHFGARRDFLFAETIAVRARAADAAPKAQRVAVLQQLARPRTTACGAQRWPLVDEAASVLRVVQQSPRTILAQLDLSVVGRDLLRRAIIVEE